MATVLKLGFGSVGVQEVVVSELTLFLVPSLGGDLLENLLGGAIVDGVEGVALRAHEDAEGPAVLVVEQAHLRSSTRLRSIEPELPLQAEVALPVLWDEVESLLLLPALRWEGKVGRICVCERDNEGSWPEVGHH